QRHGRVGLVQIGSRSAQSHSRTLSLARHVHHLQWWRPESAGIESNAHRHTREKSETRHHHRRRRSPLGRLRTKWRRAARTRRSTTAQQSQNEIPRLAQRRTHQIRCRLRMKGVPARKLAVEVLTTVEIDKAYANLALSAAFNRKSLPERDRAFV